MKTEETNQVAQAIDRLDIEQPLTQLARATWCLSKRMGDNDHLGAVEYLATETRAGLDNVAAALNNIAAAIRETRAA